ncbi:MAG TPA: TRAP transporter large permease [Desulfovibrio sp.]|uniref:TRAP transporter large permease n=1 Tax=Desulfovibrio TaxID=872 RepID=UPI002CEF7645|nr:TRAP transporter large permease [Desulfovibrio sp.]HMM38989.1 TRAP transporter large permease [Desulfovibrio sp.]
MELGTMALTGIAVLLALFLFTRLPVGFAMGMVGFAGFAAVLGPKAALGMLGTEVWNVFSSYGLTVIPLFILMGQICFYSGVNERLYTTAYAWMGHIRGGLAMATVLACAGFAAICGSNTATAATMSTVALPQMRKYKYSPVLATGSVAAGSTLGVVIPPSVVLLIIGLQTGTSIARLFWASLLPGLLLAVLFLLVVAVACRLRPQWGPTAPRASLGRRLRALPGALEMLVLFGLVMGGLFAGFFTPTEAGAAGAAAALLLSAGTRRLSPRDFIRAVTDTIKVSSMIMVIILGAVILGRFLAVTRLPYEAAAFVTSLQAPPALVVLVICAIYALGGMLMDALALLLVTLPIFHPVALALGFDPVWFGVVITVVTTMGAITPPVGVNTFIVASMAPEVPMPKVFLGVSLFMSAYLVCVLLLLFFPDLALWLPRFVG